MKADKFRYSLIAALYLAAYVLAAICSLLLDQMDDLGPTLVEIARVLRPGGLLVLSTPNRLTFPPGNVYHHRELDELDLDAADRSARARWW